MTLSRDRALAEKKGAPCLACLGQDGRDAKSCETCKGRRFVPLYVKRPTASAFQVVRAYQGFRGEAHFLPCPGRSYLDQPQIFFVSVDLLFQVDKALDSLEEEEKAAVAERLSQAKKMAGM